MDRKFSLGLLISFILAAISFMLNPYPIIGVVFFLIAIIWAYLFVLPFSPVKQYWWSVSDKLGVVPIKYGGFNAKANDKYITVYAGLRAISNIRVDKISIKVCKKEITSFSWEHTNIEGDESQYINFTVPDWLVSGRYKAVLIAYTPNGYSKSKKFILEVER